MFSVFRSSNNASEMVSEIVPESDRGDNLVDELNEKLYIAVSKELKACKSIVAWALQTAGSKRVCIIHVHQPAQTISILGGRFPISSVSEQEVRALREKEKQELNKILNEYLHICAKAGVQAEKLYIEMDTVEKGILELIAQHKIERLVMGAAADNRYSRKMMEPKSKKANHVRQHAPDYCHIWFICKGRLIYTREGTKQPYLINEPDTARLTQSTSGWSSPVTRRNSVGSFDDFDQSSTFSLSPYSGSLRYPPAGVDSTLVPFSKTEEKEPQLRSLGLPPRPEEKHYRSPSPTMLERSVNDAFYDQLEQAQTEAETSRREAFQESMKRRKAEKEALEAHRRANAAENLFLEEVKRRNAAEGELAKAKEELESIKNQRDKALEELRVALEQKLMLETRVQKSDVMEEELKDKLIFALELLQNTRSNQATSSKEQTQ